MELRVFLHSSRSAHTRLLDCSACSVVTASQKSLFSRSTVESSMQSAEITQVAKHETVFISSRTQRRVGQIRHSL